MAPALVRGSSRPQVSHGVQSGEVDASSAVLWARADRLAVMQVDISRDLDFSRFERLPKVIALPDYDYVAKQKVQHLLSDTEYFYRVSFIDIDNSKIQSKPVFGRFKTAPQTHTTVRFGWGGDTVGQGWGIDLSRGGMLMYQTLSQQGFDFFIHSGDTIYADGPLKESVTLPDGSLWKNLITEEKLKVAESQSEFFGQWKYNLLDRHVRNFNANVPVYYQWDDHEVVNNWSPGKDLSSDDRYTEKSVATLAARAANAFQVMTPIGYNVSEPGRIYRSVSYGPSLEIFFLDLRRYRSANNEGVEATQNESSILLGRRQIEWFKSALKQSSSTWKIIASDMPLGLIIWDNWKSQSGVEAIANGKHSEPLGRELEIAELLEFMATEDIRNTVWLTADVHYAAAHYYNPNSAVFKRFLPFWEFVAGPLHAGTFAPNAIDKTFGPEVKFTSAADPSRVNLSPEEGKQFFGLVEVDGDSQVMTIQLKNRNNDVLYTQALTPDFPSSPS
ncbi:alkaline phosphatase [Marinibactrum halimedae]|uniref:Alkaline phosphatase n=2 Tax=Marinibactrum halimedae TaxID=1444977 RepID=A0AA37T5S8_9GAMM|nr:alkaline phosphatase [Marinibactrum halimedae]